jgi:anti-sigma factor RsiW
MENVCLSDEQMAAYVDGLVSPEERLRIEEHLAVCGPCLRAVAEIKGLASAAGEAPAAPPEGVLSRARELVASRGGPVPELDIVAILRAGVCKILESSGNLLPPRMPSTVAIRGAPAEGVSPRVSRSMEGYLVTVELGVRESGVAPAVTLADERSGARPDGQKIRFSSEATCQIKYTRRGRAEFASVEQGRFAMEIDGVGRISLEII